MGGMDVVELVAVREAAATAAAVERVMETTAAVRVAVKGAEATAAAAATVRVAGERARAAVGKGAGAKAAAVMGLRMLGARVAERRRLRPSSIGP